MLCAHLTLLVAMANQNQQLMRHEQQGVPLGRTECGSVQPCGAMPMAAVLVATEATAAVVEEGRCANKML